jgi:hypothetical protein
MSATEMLEWRILLTGTGEVPPSSGADDGLDPDELDLALAKMFPGRS